jgi:branched-subunit amino acid aminotransferase/4-amino-4-deoxychorismate lyase
VRGGRVFFLEEHWERLVRAAVRHHFPISSLWYQGISDFFEKNLLEEGIVRIYLTAGEGAPASPIEQPQLFLFWEESIFPSEQQRQQGIALVSLDRPIGTTAWGEKSGNYWEHLTALEAARQAGAEEGLVFDRDGFLISAAMANVVLWLNDGRMITPPRARGARDGVMLDQIRQHVPALLSADLKRDDLKNVVALAICNSRLGVMPVAALDGEPVAQYQLASDLVKR